MISTLFAVAAALAGATDAAAVPKAKTVVAVGDIACPPSYAVTATTCHHAAVAKRAAALKPDSVWLLGDIQYETGTLNAFRGSFGPAWDGLRRFWRPAPGNHEYATPGAAGYYDFFGWRAGPKRRGYYSFELGAWHVVSLNSNCAQVSCSAKSPQVRWLRRDLARTSKKCVAAFWHHPRYNSGRHGNEPRVIPLLRELRKARVEFVTNGHDHLYERFAPMDEHGKRSSHGVRQFTAGTGGKSLYTFKARKPGSEFQRMNSYGVLALTLRAGGYGWRFVDEDGSVHDRGHGRCR